MHAQFKQSGRGIKWTQTLALVICMMAISACALVGQGAPRVMISGYPDVQQSLDYTCGAAAASAFLQFYGIKASELEGARAMRTDPKSGTAPEAMVSWLQAQGLKIAWGEQGGLDLLKRNFQQGRPTLVLWTDWGGHWVAVIGYDDKGTYKTDDDDLTLADPYDRVDGYPDGRIVFNAERFDSMWFDALNFGRLMRHVYLYVPR
jgi:hypothetical protein